MLDYVLRPRAQLDLESIAIFLAVERKNPQAAHNAITKIDRAIDMVRDMPDMGGHIHIEELEHEYRTIPADPYMIYYRYDPDVLTIYRILHQRQDMDTYALVEF